MYFVRNLILFVFVLSVANLNGQFWLSNEDIYEEADAYIQSEEFKEALSLFHLLEKKGIINDNIRYKIGLCYLQINGKKLRSITYLEEASDSISCNYISSLNQTKAPAEAIFLLANAYRINYEFNKAIKTFNNYKKQIKLCGTKDSDKVDYYIQQCKNARQLFNNKPVYTEKIVFENTNSQFTKYNPVVLNSETEYYYMEEFKFYDAIMFTELKKNKFNKPQNLTPVVGSDGDHVLVGSSTNGNYLFFYFFTEENTGDIFLSKKENGTWKTLFRLPEPINSPSNELYASLSITDSLLFFTSNRKGGYGGTDIYISKMITDSTWTNPVNIGEAVNSSLNEASPFYVPEEKTLYFTSQGHFNSGGFDVFSIKFDGKVLSDKPVNLGYPFSTPDNDEYYFPVSSNIGYCTRTIKSDQEQLKLFEIRVTGQKEQNEFNAAKTDSVEKAQIQQFDSIVTKVDIEVPAISDTIKSVAICDILFEFDKAVVNPNYYGLIDTIADLLNKENCRVILTGYADTKGSNEYNKVLSNKRARAVERLLIEKGVSPQKITTYAKGETNQNDTSISSDKNYNSEIEKFNRCVTINFENLPRYIKIVRKTSFSEL